MAKINKQAQSDMEVERLAQELRVKEAQRVIDETLERYPSLVKTVQKIAAQKVLSNAYKIIGDTDSFIKANEEIINLTAKFTSAAHTTNTQQFRAIYGAYEDAHFNLAPYSFHRFLMCMEWEYKPEKKFYANRYSVMRDWAKEMERLEFGELDILGLSAPPRTGKAQPLRSKVLTPKGWTTMGEVQVGDVVIGADGKGCTVTEIFPQGEKDIYRVTFEDGTYTDCVRNHLWTYYVNGEKKVADTFQMKYDAFYNQVTIPLVKPIEHDGIEIENAYFFGGKFALNRTPIPEEYIFACLKSRQEFFDGIRSKVGTNREGNIVLPNIAGLASLSRSLGYKVVCKGNYLVLNKKPKKVVSVEPVGREEAKCIVVDHPEHLYVTDDYILTHNSGIETLFMLWVAGRHPDKSILFATHTNAMAVKIMQDFYNMATDPRRQYSRCFPGIQIEKSSEYNWIDFSPKKDPNNYKTIYFRGIDGSFAGVLEASWLIVVDDLIKNIEEALNPVRLETANQKYGVDITQRRTDDSVKELHIATRWSVNDVMTRLEADNEGNPRAKFIKVPGLNEKGESNFNFPYRPMTKEHFEKLRRSMDEVSFECIVQQNPIERDGLIFMRDSLSYYEGELPMGEPDEVVFWADLAFGGGDFLSMPIAYVYGNDAYIHDVVHSNKTKFDTKPLVVDAIIRNKCTRGGGEANNGGDEYMSDIDQRLRERGYRCHIISQKAPTTKSKLARILDAQAEIKAIITDDTGFRLHFLSEHARKGKPMYEKYMEHLMKFNQGAKYIGKQKDDAADATAGLVANILNRNNKSGKVYALSRKWLAI